MSIKLIAIDLDGTLLHPQRHITSRVKQAITEARNKGVYIVLSTGRPYIGVQRYLLELDLLKEGQFCITNNGALVQQANNGDCISEIVLSFDDYLYFEQLSRQLGVRFQALSHSLLFTAEKNISKYTVQEAALTGIPLRYRTVQEMDCHLTFPKVMMIDSPEKLDNAIQKIPAEAYEKYTLMKSAPCYLEILNKQGNKGVGVKMLADKLALSRDEIMAIGDQENDLAMLSFAGIGVAMGNGIEAVKAISQFVTKTNMEDGVAHAIEKFVL